MDRYYRRIDSADNTLYIIDDDKPDADGVMYWRSANSSMKSTSILNFNDISTNSEIKKTIIEITEEDFYRNLSRNKYKKYEEKKPHVVDIL